MPRNILLLLAMSLMIFSVYALEPLNFENCLPQTRTVYTAPYSQDFNSVANGNIPVDWWINDNGFADPLYPGEFNMVRLAAGFTLNG